MFSHQNAVVPMFQPKVYDYVLVKDDGQPARWLVGIVIHDYTHSTSTGLYRIRLEDHNSNNVVMRYGRAALDEVRPVPSQYREPHPLTDAPESEFHLYEFVWARIHNKWVPGMYLYWNKMGKYGDGISPEGHIVMVIGDPSDKLYKADLWVSRVKPYKG